MFLYSRLNKSAIVFVYNMKSPCSRIIKRLLDIIHPLSRRRSMPVVQEEEEKKGEVGYTQWCSMGIVEIEGTGCPRVKLHKRGEGKGREEVGTDARLFDP